MTTEVLTIDTGLANLASLRAAFARLGREMRMVRTPGELATEGPVVLPGVGSFGAGMAALRQQELVDALVERFDRDRPTLAICLGMQLLAACSEEAPGVAGLGVVPGTVRAFPEGVVRPQQGWNEVQPPQPETLVEPGWAAFSNGYALLETPSGWRASTAEYGVRFCAALERGRVLACQFHPELSGPWGQALLARFLARASREVASC